MGSRTWWMAGLGLACVACCAIPLLGGAAIGASAGLAFGSGWSAVALLAVGVFVAGAVAMRPGRTAQACAASSGCGCGAPAGADAPGEEKPPIACTLTGDDFAGRTTWIRQLAKDYLIAVGRTPLSLQLTYAPAAASKVKELVRKEQACCAFLRFDLREVPDGVHLTVTAPEEAREAVDMLFDHFAPDAVTPSLESTR